jgi:hypothetical protein
MLDRLAADPKSPVEFDERLNEYHLKGQREYVIMKYCFWCSGRLPDSRRGELFTEPIDEEMSEVRSIHSRIKTVEDALKLLGPPDETHEWDDEFAQGREIENQWRQSLVYSSRWDTLVLHVQEMPDGRIAFSVSGQYVAPPPEETSGRKSRWWHFWQKWKRKR